MTLPITVEKPSATHHTLLFNFTFKTLYFEFDSKWYKSYILWPIFSIVFTIFIWINIVFGLWAYLFFKPLKLNFILNRQE